MAVRGSRPQTERTAKAERSKGTLIRLFFAYMGQILRLSLRVVKRLFSEPAGSERLLSRLLHLTGIHSVLVNIWQQRRRSP